MNTARQHMTGKAELSDTAAIIGMGKTGQSVARFMLDQGNACEGFDENPVNLPKGLSIPLYIGPLDAETLSRYGRIVVSPGVAWSHPVLRALRNADVPVAGDLEIFSEHFSGTLIGVTGTNGKTTTVSLIETLLDTLPGGVEAGGNIGIPMLDLIKQNQATERIVLELSSFQLERCQSIHPQWAVLLNLQPDHADMHTDAAAYEAAKLRLFTQQGKGDTAMLPNGPAWDELAQKLRARKVRVYRFDIIEGECPADGSIAAGLEMADGHQTLFWHQDGKPQHIDIDEIPARGSHQHLNLAVAAQAAADFGVSANVIREAMTSFSGLKHRLQYLGFQAGHDWFDDSKATNPDATKAALTTFDRVHWICGGLIKGLDLSPLKETARSHVEHAFIIGSNTECYSKFLSEAGVPYTTAGQMEQAVTLASQMPDASPVLLSPAAASQDQFRNYAERGTAFARAIMQLGGQA
ncbi:MAG: UDP-N-acetylmuramoyl-L-alanine--D-glutamate ligase [Mariprofundaceae bacterium]